MLKKMYGMREKVEQQQAMYDRRECFSTFKAQIHKIVKLKAVTLLASSLQHACIVCNSCSYVISSVERDREKEGNHQRNS